MRAHPTTLAGPVEASLAPIKGSRFIGFAAPAFDRPAWDALVAARKALWPDARHHCWAWIGFGPTDRAFSDAGEPNGSAGRPILDVLAGQELQGVGVVVSRWFGGTRLGVGGLVRAYGAAANAALALGQRKPLIPTVLLEITVGYADTHPVEGLLAQRGLSPQRRFGAASVLSVEVEAAEAAALVAALRDATAGRAICVIPEAAP